VRENMTSVMDSRTKCGKLQQSKSVLFMNNGSHIGVLDISTLLCAF